MKNMAEVEEILEDHLEIGVYSAAQPVAPADGKGSYKC